MKLIPTNSLKLKWSWSLVLHGMLLAAFCLSFKQAVQLASPATTPKPVIEAVALDQKQIQAEVARLNKIEDNKKLAEKKKLAELDRKTKEAKKARELEQEKVEKLKKEAEELKIAKIEAEKQKLVEAKELAKIQARKKEEETRLVKAEKERKETEKKIEEKLAQEKRAKVLAEKKAEEEAEAALQDIIARDGREQRDQSELQRYLSLINTSILDNWDRPPGLTRDIKCDVEMKLSGTGEVLQVKIVRSSGNIAFDHSTEKAIRKASPFRMPENKHLLNALKEFDFTFSPGSA